MIASEKDRLTLTFNPVAQIDDRVIQHVRRDGGRADAQTLLRHQSDPPSKLRQFLGHLNPKLVNAVVEMLSFNLADRPKAKNLLDTFVKFEIENMVSG